MDKFLNRPNKERSLSPLRTQAPIYLGILGYRNDMNMEELCENVLHPLVQSLTRLPEKVILPVEGTSSIYISDWAERSSIPYQEFISDWKRDGRRARILRDSRILKEATHLLCINGPRSTYYETLGTKNVKKKEAVYVLEYKTKEVSELTI